MDERVPSCTVLQEKTTAKKSHASVSATSSLEKTLKMWSKMKRSYKKSGSNLLDLDSVG